MIDSRTNFYKSVNLMTLEIVQCEGGRLSVCVCVCVCVCIQGEYKVFP